MAATASETSASRLVSSQTARPCPAKVADSVKTTRLRHARRPKPPQATGLTALCAHRCMPVKSAHRVKTSAQIRAKTRVKNPVLPHALPVKTAAALVAALVNSTARPVHKTTASSVVLEPSLPVALVVVAKVGVRVVAMTVAVLVVSAAPLTQAVPSDHRLAQASLASSGEMLIELAR